MQAVAEALDDLFDDEDVSAAVTYSRGASEVDIRAVSGTAYVEHQGENGEYLRTELRVHLVRVSELSSVWPPQRGDIIQQTFGSASVRFEVLPVVGKSCWEYADADQQHVRILSKLVSAAGS
jgi:hypothetical protein